MSKRGSNSELFAHENDALTARPQLHDSCVKRFLNKLFISRPLVCTVNKKEILLVLPYLGNVSLETRTNLTKMVSSSIPFCKLKVLFKSSLRLGTLFNFKDHIPKTLLSGVVYKLSCGGCNATYIGKIKRHFKKRVSEHIGVSALTGKVLKGQQSESVRDHMLDLDHVVNLDDFILMTPDNSDYLLQIKESLFICSNSGCIELIRSVH